MESMRHQASDALTFIHKFNGQLKAGLSKLKQCHVHMG